MIIRWNCNAIPFRRPYGGRLGRMCQYHFAKIENLQNHKTILENQISHIPHTSQASCTFASRNRDYPVVYAHEIHAYVDAYEVYAREMHAREIHAREVYTYEVHVCEMHVYEVIPMRCTLVRYTPEVHAYEIHTYEVYARGTRLWGAGPRDTRP